MEERGLGEEVPKINNAGSGTASFNE